MRGDDDLLDKTMAALTVGVREPVKQGVLLRVFSLVEQVATFLVAERFAIGDQKLQVACIGRIDVREIDFVDDAVAKREPNAGTAVIRSTDAVLGAGRPARLNPWHSKGDGFLIHWSEFLVISQNHFPWGSSPTGLSQPQISAASFSASDGPQVPGSYSCTGVAKSKIG